MELKIHLSLFFLCLSVMFGDCSDETTSSSSLLSSASSRQPETATSGSSPTYYEKQTNSEWTELPDEEKSGFPSISQATSPAAQGETNSPEETKGTTPQAPSTSSGAPSSGRVPGHVTWDELWDAPFHYDYGILRRVGLSLAAVLFLMGIAVMTCGRVCRKHRCNVGPGRSYNVSKA
ncbi:hypothetical protein GN956_G5092 [Arapaima gigas]